MEVLLDTQTGHRPGFRLVLRRSIVNNSPANNSLSNNSDNNNGNNSNANNAHINADNPVMADASDAPRLQSITSTDINALAEDLAIAADENSNNNSNN
ncbi:hypothetical protein [Streptomyces sp. NPDC086787]|uniref:hypothetical protein n=1 Tax=Streptomyces sp. NPDC086787 TaxID=3365759 RepID=UPI00382A3A11